MKSLDKIKKIIKEEIQNVLKEIHHEDTDLANKYKGADDDFIAYNESYWQWEYDMSIRHAFLYLNKKTKELKLVIVNEYVKTGLGAGKTYKVLEYEDVGTVNKPLLSKIRSLLKTHSHQRTRAGYPFPQLWMNPKRDYKTQPLSSIIEEYKNV